MIIKIDFDYKKFGFSQIEKDIQRLEKIELFKNLNLDKINKFILNEDYNALFIELKEKINRDNIKWVEFSKSKMEVETW